MSPSDVSWYQPASAVSIELIEALGIAHDGEIIDVGGGASVLVDGLLEMGFSDLTVLDVSGTALQSSRARVDESASVTWVQHDVLTWEPQRTFALWHDRAVFHFMSGDEIEGYLQVLRRALAPDGAVIMATFAPEGPEQCSGLPVTRYDTQGLMSLLSTEFELAEARHEIHTTPSGSMQPFNWIAARRVPH